jgi:SulP family sulfate permease
MEGGARSSATGGARPARRILTRLLPVHEWLPRYSRRDLAGDLPAGLTIGAMLIPQGMAYALLAGLPPEMGLYASVLPLLAYALLGKSRQLGVGPTAISSLLTAAGLAELSGGDPRTYVALAATLAVVVGLMRVTMGLFRLGFVVNFLSRPVLSGFTSAAALIIGASQLKHLLGVDLGKSSSVVVLVTNAARQIGDVDPSTLGLGLGGIALLGVLRHWRPSWPGALLVVMAATGAVALFGLDHQGVSVVGRIPGRLPSLRVPTEGLGRIGDMFPTAVAITMLGFVESIAVAQVFAQRHGYTIRPNRELVALGVATVAAGVSGAYPVSGSFSRTAVNEATGARTQMAGVISAGVVALTLVVLTPLFRPLPNAVLASVVIVAVAGLVDVAEARRLWRVKRSDFVLLVVAFASTVLLGVERGLLVSVVASLGVVIRQTTRPHTAILGRIPGSTAYRNVDRAPEAVTVDGVVVLRIDAPLYFANVEFIQDRLRQIETAEGARLRVLVLDLSSVNDLDSSADRALQEIAGDYGRRGVELYVANAKGRVRDVMRRSGLHDLLGPERFFLDTDEAVRYAERVVKPEPEASEASDVRDVSHGSDVVVDLTREIPVADKRAGV